MNIGIFPYLKNYNDLVEFNTLCIFANMALFVLNYYIFYPDLLMSLLPIIGMLINIGISLVLSICLIIWICSGD